jgi:hypothetical protein
MTSITIRKQPVAGKQWNGERAWIFESGKRLRVYQTDCYGVNLKYHADRASAVSEALDWLAEQRARLDAFEATL